MKHLILDSLLLKLKDKFGDLSNEGGCYLDNGEWLSIANIVELIYEVDEEY